eukprot:CAMPEP_0175147686 /NCGR_PEP_ID=MMETSP0087-20121206/16140_1 /TAXON_ID=136419 /ORGANISM="Unknown Unknown, Strain D1" /LENGTH=245 /DNA_ID=CAMNT_0016432923 /DNA_START=11 /DNA_END=747 /DNA_ORIENTATION=+
MGTFDKKKGAQALKKRRGPILTFDDAARKDFVTGFKKRKDERRKIGHLKAQQLEIAKKRFERKERKKNIDAIIAEKVKQREALLAKGEDDSEDSSEEESSEGEDSEQETAANKQSTYDDGDSVVTVVTSTIDQDQESEAEDDQDQDEEDRAILESIQKKKQAIKNRPLSKAQKAHQELYDEATIAKHMQALKSGGGGGLKRPAPKKKSKKPQQEIGLKESKIQQKTSQRKKEMMQVLVTFSRSVT